MVTLFVQLIKLLRYETNRKMDSGFVLDDAAGDDGGKYKTVE